MALCVGDLDDQQIARLRAELMELLAQRFAYPPFFSYSAGEARMRPADRAKRQEIADYLRMVNFQPLARVEVSAPEVRRYFETIVLGYIERNPSLARRYVARHVPTMRASVPKAVSGIQRGFVAFVQGTDHDYGGPKPTPSWEGPARRAPFATDEDLERSTGILATVLARSHAPESHAAMPIASVPPHTAPATPRVHVAPPTPRLHADAREPTPETYRMYGEYLDELNTEQRPAVNGTTNGSAFSPEPLGTSLWESRPAAPNASGIPSTRLPARGAQSEPRPLAATPDASGTHASGTHASGTHASGTHASGTLFGASRPTASSGGEARLDEMIFRQLRHQLEAYVRRTARSNGLLTIAGGDPMRMLDLLRRANRIDEADARLIEGILALTDRVEAQGEPSLADYRQAMMLYLLYHRSQLGE